VIRSQWDLAKYLESGRLRRILPEFSLPSADLYVYYPSKQNLAARARAFINFLIEELATEG
jgi:DNA-binding transcriptional LysR family regulator